MSSGAGNSGNDAPVGQMTVRDPNSEVNRDAFQSRQQFGERRTHFTAKIVKVKNRNSLTEPCTVDIQPTVKQLDGSGKAMSHGIIHNVPIPRIQSGDSVFVNDPQVGDVGNFSVLDRDHKSAQANDWSESNPGSQRRNDMSDAIYHSTLPRKAQEVKQYVRMDENGVDIRQRDGHTFAITKDGFNLNGVKIDKDGNLTAPGKVVAGQGGSDQVSLQSHLHGSGPAPTPGS